MAAKKKKPTRRRPAAKPVTSRKRKPIVKGIDGRKRKPIVQRVGKRKGRPVVKLIESRRVVIKFHNNVTLPYTDEWADKREAGKWEELEARFGKLTLRRMFTSVTPQEIRELSAMAVRVNLRYRGPNFLTYFFVDLQPKVRAEQVARAFLKWRTVQYAYVDYPTTNPQPPGSGPHVCITAPGYRDAAPKGVSAARAAAFRGGDGAKQHFVDIESGWTTDHVSVATYFIPPKLIPPTPLTGVINKFSRHHGTAVLGIVCGKGLSPGCTGLAPGVASVRIASTYFGGLRPSEQRRAEAAAANAPVNLYDAIKTATHALVASTAQPAGAQVGRRALMLIEQQVVLSLEIGTNEATSYLPVEYLAGLFDLIQDAFQFGIAVIEAAGNGRELHPTVGMDLDSIGIQQNLQQDSGAIMVGAAQSKLLEFPLDPSKDGHNVFATSNFGSRVDCYALGDSVVAPTSSEVLPVPPPPHPAFTIDECRDDFGSTSAASAILAGVALVLQGIATGSSLGHPLHPTKLREILRKLSNGTPIYNVPDPPPAPPRKSRPIGVMPDLEKILQTDSSLFCPMLGATLTPFP